MNTRAGLVIEFVSGSRPGGRIVAEFRGSSGVDYAVLREATDTDTTTTIAPYRPVTLSFEPGSRNRIPGAHWCRLDETLRAGWLPGILYIDGATELPPAFLTVLAEFAYYEARLREMENEVEGLAETSSADVMFAHRPRWRDRQHWPRFQAKIEQASILRLTYARLEPSWEKGGWHLPRDHQRLVTKMLRRAGVPERASALGERLESMEDLYEGANDRVAEYRWFLSGTALEIAIVILLVAEAVVMGADVYIRTK